MLKDLLEIKVKRVGSSPYFPTHFIADEKNTLENIPRVKMLKCDQDESEIAQASIIISNTHFKFTPEKLSLFKNCHLIIHSNSGYDNFDFDFVKNFSGDILLGNQIRSHAVASYILSAFFQHFSGIPNQKNWDKERKYPRKPFEQLKVQLIGFGTIGKLVAKSLQAFNIQLKIVDPYLNLSEQHLEAIDAVILCCGYNSSNHHMINHNFLKNLSPDALIINPARGELINTVDLINFLEVNPKAFAFLDVFETEPNDFLNFQHLKNINTTSHIAGVFAGIENATIEFEKQIIQDFLHLNANEFKMKHAATLLKNKIIGNEII